MAKHSNGDFGEYNSVKLTGTYSDIKKDKLAADADNFEPYKVKDSEINYIKVAEMLADKFVSGVEWDENDKNAYKAVCMLAAGDMNLLKGKFVVSNFIESKKSFQRYNKGKHLTLSNQQIDSILLHRFGTGNKMTQNTFCKTTQITKPTYNKVVKMDYKHQTDINRINERKLALGLTD